jgi:ribosomal protein S6
MKIYELSYLIPSDLADADAKALKERVGNYIADLQGAIDKMEDLPTKRTDACFSSVTFFLNAEKLSELRGKIKSEGKIVNFMIVNKPVQKAVAAPRRRPLSQTTVAQEASQEPKETSKKVEIEEIEKKLEEILGE